ncbi:bifunctional riboflavin kinase/FAD synthetase [Sphingomonas quercus]|uniref:Riboflavin biosynthesis protein n=1 Tax=Sphingomonas quercus TaxID=2842451 RepID=A0ABS6BIL6_9SPHN|nr:bifunctional riboflavin kinase/FAD synthetase [Sphingomonas quercus]MBU3077286.1 bifunctional riboflavin kinase/FAD synthetase [Sphingomonas quercus]
METLSSDVAVPAGLRGAIVALGNFDGFHRGHQAVVGRAVSRARAEGRPAIVATFDPHPARLFRPDAAPFLLTTIPQRVALFAAAGADAAYVLRFDRALAGVAAAEFVSDWLVGRIGAAGVVTGEDFSFGRGGAGNAAVLAELAGAHGVSADAVAPVVADEAPVSSSRIRQALRDADPGEAARLLTRPFAIRGTVIHGDKRGRTIGYPTANLLLGDYVRPAYGIYAVRGRLADGRVLDGAANLGVRPSFDPPRELLEPYFFDFSGDLYGQEISVELIAHLRAEARFDTLAALTAQMEADCERARAILAGNRPLA